MGVRIRIQSVKHMWLWQVFEHQSNRNGANVLFHQLKQLYHVVVCVECYAVLKSACFWCRYMFKCKCYVFSCWMCLCICVQSVIRCGDVIFPSIDGNVHVL